MKNKSIEKSECIFDRCVSPGLSRCCRTVVVFAFSLFTAVLFWGACSGEKECGKGVAVEISFGEGLEIEAEIDRLEIAIAANGSEEFCGPDVHVVSLEEEPVWSKGIFSLCIRTGEVFNEQVFVRVSAFLGETMRYRSEHAASLGGGEVRVRIIIDEDCLNSTIGDRQHCRDGKVVESPFWKAFEEGEGVISCGEWVF